MKKLLIIGISFFTAVSCKDMQKENQELTVQTAAIDSMKMAMEKQRIIDSVRMAESSKKEVVVVNNASPQSNTSTAPRKKNEWRSQRSVDWCRSGSGNRCDCK